MAIEIVDFPTNSMGGSFHSYVNVYQAGYMTNDRSGMVQVGPNLGQDAASGMGRVDKPSWGDKGYMGVPQ